ncbi:hypothetical protein FBU30_007600 [Linnemannia zychae]|nr:hypothetical protein FBU30_007600 [Linnemannia zychae]
MRGHATTQLKATNVKVLFGYQTIEHEGDDSDQQQQFNDDNSNTIYNNNNDNSATLATSVLTKQISRLFKDSSEDKSHVLALPQPSTVASTYTGLFQLIETATAKANFISTTLSHSPSIHDTRSTNVIASPTTIPDMKTAKSNAIRLDIFSHNVTQHPASFIPSITHTGSNRTLELDDYHVLLDEMRTSFMAVYDFEDPLEISPCSSYEREPLMSKESCKSDVTQWIISQLIESFIKIKPKSPEAIAEIVLIGPVLDEKTYRTLFNCFISEVKNTSSLDLLKGLVQLVECASNGYLVGDDLSRAIIALSERMSSPLTCTNKYHSYLVWALSHILDMTVSGIRPRMHVKPSNVYLMTYLRTKKFGSMSKKQYVFH